MSKRRIDGRETEEVREAEMETDAEPLDVLFGRHQIEGDVQRELLGHAGLHFSSLVVRRVRDGVCLEGVLEADDVGAASSDVCGLARRVAGVNEVLNHLLVRHPDQKPAAKG